MDEAQLLVSEERGVTAEHVLAEVRQISPDCKIVLMTAFADVQMTLRAVLSGLGSEPVLLASALRPTRRIYGVLRAFQTEHEAELQVVAYPPRSTNEEDVVISPFVVHLPDRVHRGGRSATQTASRFAALATTGGLRTVVFANQKRSTESQAESIARRSSRVFRLPEKIASRLHVELGRPSFLEEVVPFAVAPHHAGLTAVEQHIVERLVATRHVLTVIATPTLAQGVNLPLDVALVTFTQRRDSSSGQMEDLSEAEVRNMLGRAGRAGIVPDGLCLVVRKESSRAPAVELSRERRWFFSRPRVQPAPGVVSLLRRARDSGVAHPSWVDLMPGLRFSESQALLSMVGRRLQQNAELNIMLELTRYPSFRALTDAEQAELASAVSALADNVAARLATQPATLAIVARSGMPIPFVEAVVAAVTEVTNADKLLESDWWDREIEAFLHRFGQFSWVTELTGPFQQTGIMNVISTWRRGDPIRTLEIIAPTDDDRRTRIRTGEYLNHSLSLLAQFWAIAPLSVDVLGIELNSADLRHFAACVRDGVPDIDALIWLRALGGMDRVLATALSAEAILPDTGGYYFRRRVANDLLDSWERGDQSPLRGEQEEALHGLLEENELLGLA